MTFHVGQKVVCIYDFSNSPVMEAAKTWHLAIPEKDKIYTIRELFKWNGETGLRLYEIVNSKMLLSDNSVAEVGFQTQCFRPLVERRSSTDISFALDILDKANRQIKEPTGA